MNKNLRRKLRLDAFMLVIFVLVLRKSNLDMMFHEVAGLGVAAAFAAHLILNRQWIGGITRRFFSRNLPLRARLCWLVDLGLLISFTIIIVSGVQMSHVLFGFWGTGREKLPHYFFSSVAMVLMGIHLGLHSTMIANALKKVLRLKGRAAKLLGIGLTVILVVIGCINTVRSPFAEWAAMPVQKISAKLGISGRPDGGELFRDGEGMHKGEGQGMQNGFGEGRDKHNGGENRGFGEGQHPNARRETLPGNVLQMFSVIYLFAAVTAGLDSLLSRKKKRKTA